jgi:hypothetical protein
VGVTPFDAVMNFQHDHKACSNRELLGTTGQADTEEEMNLSFFVVVLYVRKAAKGVSLCVV